MKAIVYTKYGPPKVLHLRDVEKPIPGDNEVLIQVYAAAVNSWDWDLLRGKPLLFRLLFGLFKSKYKILGADIAGRIEAAGKKVTRFQVGDHVFGDLCTSGWGGFAEYVCARENALTLKPASMTFEQAAAIPQAGVMALQSVRDNGQIQKGQKVLINGAGGGVGTFAVQIAKSFGAEVTGVDSAPKLEMLRSIGADQVIDYTQEDFTKNGKQYDLIIDVVGSRSIFDYKRSLNPNGIFVLVGGTLSTIFQVMLLGPVISKISRRKLGILVHKPNHNVTYLNELFEAGDVMPVIDKTFPLDAAPAALRHLGEGHVKGKIVITINNNHTQKMREN